MSARELEPVVGLDGFMTLALSVVVMLLSFGTTYVAALGYVAWIAWQTSPDPAFYARLLVLGMRLDATDQPTTGYRARLDRARILWSRLPTSEIIILGGQTSASRHSEASIGAAYLIQHGVASDRIQTEDRSRHTLENLRQYRARFPADQTLAPVLITNRFHLARSSLLASGLGLAHTRCAAETRRLPSLGDLQRMPFEALLIHWYITGRTFSRLTGNKRMASRIT